MFQLLAETVGEQRIARVASRIEREITIAPDAAKQAAAANAAIIVRVMLAGLLSPSAGGVTESGLDWAAVWLRRELDTQVDARADLQEGG